MSLTKLNTFRARWNQGAGPELNQDVDRFLQTRLDQSGDHFAWATFCEQLGMMNAAMREYQLALRDDPVDEKAAFRLALLYRERGQPGRATPLFASLLEKDPARLEWLEPYLGILVDEGALPLAREALNRARQAGLDHGRAVELHRRLQSHPPEKDDSASSGDIPTTEAELARFLHLFSGREGVHARQWARPNGDTGYSPVQEPLTPAVAKQHLLGNYTVGVYPLRVDGTCVFFALDLDIDKAALEQAAGKPAFAQQLRQAMRDEGLRLLAVFHDLGIDPLFEDSGYKGRHLWVFFEEPESAELLNQFGRWLIAWQQSQLARGLHLEFFPRQGQLQGKGLGNLIKLPLGIHRKTGRRALLLDDQGQPLSSPMDRLTRIHRLSRSKLYSIMEQLKGLAASAPSSPPAKAKDASPSLPPRQSAPDLPPSWTAADFDSDPAMRHLLHRCPVLAELKRQAEENRRLHHEEQLVLIHTLGHLDGGPQAVNYLLDKCVDVGREKHLKGKLRGHPVSCPSIRKKIGHLTRRLPCNCAFDFAPDRYPTPVLHLLTLPSAPSSPPSPSTRADTLGLAQRFAVLSLKRREIEQEFEELQRSLIDSLRRVPDRLIRIPGGQYFLRDIDGVEELVWSPDPELPTNESPPSSGPAG